MIYPMILNIYYLDIQLCSNLTSKCEAKIKNEAIAVY